MKSAKWRVEERSEQTLRETRENVTCEGVLFTVFEVCEVLHEPHVGSYTSLSVLDYSDSCFREELRRSDPTKKSAGIPSNLNPASNELISDSVELCETEVCFLRIQLIGTNV